MRILKVLWESGEVVWVLLLALILLVLLHAEQAPWLKRLDNELFGIGIKLVAQPKIKDNIAMVTVPAATDQGRADQRNAPEWGSWFIGGVLGLFFLYLFFLLPKIPIGAGFILTLFMVFAAITAQFGLLVSQGLWINSTVPLAFLFAGHALMFVKRGPDRAIYRIKQDTEMAFSMLGTYQHKHGDIDQAISTLKKCNPTKEILEKLYNIGLETERRRQYEVAYDVFSYIIGQQRSYKDAATHLKSLNNLYKTHLKTGTPASLGATLVSPEHGLQLPSLGRYEIERELGRGAMGTVYLGKDPKIMRTVAIKTLDLSQFNFTELDTVKQRFFREAETAGRLDHPNIVTIHDVGDERDFAFIAMDYVPASDMNAYTNSGQLLAISKVYTIMAQVAEALDYAHGQGVVHRDIKPANLLFNEKTGEIKITDFGIARITDETRTRSGTILGSPSYMAPEQLSGAKVDGRADIFSLGVTFYQLLTGLLPFSGDNLANLAYQIMQVKHPSIRKQGRELPASATRIINKALQKKPNDRFSSGLKMAEMLRKGLKHSALGEKIGKCA